jgi:hypothetical protein
MMRALTAITCTLKKRVAVSSRAGTGRLLR